MTTPNKAKSWVWKYFGRADKEVECSKCNKKMAYHGGTSSMASHLEKIHGLCNTNCAKDVPSVKHFFSTPSKRCTVDRAKEINKMIAAFIAKDMRPINTVEVSIISLYV
jgi:hypothetical protein